MKKVLPVRTQIRIPPELHTRLVEEASKNDSSLNDAMIFYIEQGLKYQEENSQQEPKRTPKVHSDFIEEKIGISDQAIEKIADKLAERLNQK
ncbi:hypothetical protein F900_02092 [Acinetobacter modestus]|uniref:Arc-like DNA binding domain-containing protein n=1 Tax=Acinetobacter modestus TaxID=1776740 RepID=N9N4A7_9GAMM|nr:toxin-antitoxin system HicB family antitoxin [Acinetobacter modestus]ENX00421.1 hypothetical protein F900_02092 [Acinetobacter modestus]